MAPFLLLLILLSGAASDLIEVTVHPGDDVILPCQAVGSSIRVVEWTRPDLKPDTLLYYRDGRLTPDDQHPSFKDRVELVDRDLKDGDVSLILKNVRRHDAGTYECRVKSGDTDPIRLIRIIHLQVRDLTVVTVPGDDVILPCRAAGSSIRAAEWTRADLKKPEYVLFYTDGHLDAAHQHPSFKDRVELVDRDLKDGNVSLILKSVSSIDNGTYECRVAPGGSRRKKRSILNSEPIRIIRLQVREPAGSNSGRHEDEISSPVGRDHGLAAAVLVLVAAAVVGVLMYKRCKNKRPGQPE
ncbi:coxsackievirus and adenovirus receptor-like isoform X2 [Perca fluviatilis]|uniref:coxsackievirus and adenovirus receptor-like isoform X2 n=1 Tax=Perca fluviatilis TaxID=8168 RepID=UPI0019626AA0|nr:coxsackievirus and adenovirus receptor-like isoform X2 [Perca fluviatilis]